MASPDDMDDDDSIASPVSPGVPPPVIPRFSWSSRLRLAVNPRLQGDKILLPVAALESMVEAGDMPSPLVFEIVNFRSRRKVFGGVREFTSEPGFATVPQWMQTALSAESSDTVTLRVVDLPKGTYLKLQPLTADYLEIGDLRAELESLLRGKYTTLTAGEVLDVEAVSVKTRERRTFSFMLSEVRPADDGGVRIVDADIEVDVVPLDAEMASEAVRLRFLVGDADAGTELVWGEAADGKGKGRSLPPGEAVATRVGETLAAGEWRYYRVKTRDGNWRHYAVELAVDEGDADVFVDTEERQPSPMDHTWFSVDSGSKSLHLDVTRPPYLMDGPGVDQSLPEGAKPPFIYFGVRGVAANSRFSLVVRSTASAPASEPLEPAPDGGDEPAPGPDFKRCANCTQWIPARTLAMHEAFCLRNKRREPRRDLR